MFAAVAGRSRMLALGRARTLSRPSPLLFPARAPAFFAIIPDRIHLHGESRDHPILACALGLELPRPRQIAAPSPRTYRAIAGPWHECRVAAKAPWRPRRRRAL